MDELLTRYTPSQRLVVASFFEKLAATVNKTGKMAESRKIKILRSWEGFPPETVIEALKVYNGMDIAQAANGKGKNEKYVLGIIRNKAGDRNAGDSSRGRHGGYPGAAGADEGERLRRLIGERAHTANELDCDF